MRQKRPLILSFRVGYEYMETTLHRVKKLLRLFQEGKILTLPHHEVHPDVEKGSRENYLYFTLPCCINFQRSSPAMWQSALATYLDPETNYLFFRRGLLRQIWKRYVLISSSIDSVFSPINILQSGLPSPTVSIEILRMTRAK